ncbi:MAG: alpha/beta fold hydrolase [Myxococcota bacterium]
MATFLLIHGAWHGGWCWDRLAPHLAAAGHRVLAPDLPGHGADRTPRWRVTLGDYAEAVHEAARSAGGPVIGVGHSMGGLVLSQAAHDAPELFAARVYLCAFVPESGDSLASLGRADPASAIPGAARLRGLHPEIAPELVREVFYGDCTEDDVAWARERLCPNPIRPLLQGASLERPVVGPAAYIECTEDAAVSLDHQRCMRDRLRDPHVVTMIAAHSPFLSAPKELSMHLDEYASDLTRAS